MTAETVHETYMRHISDTWHYWTSNFFSTAIQCLKINQPFYNYKLHSITLSDRAAKCVAIQSQL